MVKKTEPYKGKVSHAQSFSNDTEINYRAMFKPKDKGLLYVFYLLNVYFARILIFFSTKYFLFGQIYKYWFVFVFVYVASMLLYFTPTDIIKVRKTSEITILLQQ